MTGSALYSRHLSQNHSILDFSDPHIVACWAACIFGFFLLLRKSNLVPDKADEFRPDFQFVRSDIKWHPEAMLISCLGSKVNQYKERVVKLPLVAIPDSPLCPCKAYEALCKNLPNDDSLPVFLTIKNRKIQCFTYHHLQDFIKRSVAAIGLDPSKNVGHF